MMLQFEIFGMELLDHKDLVKMLFRFGVNIVFALVLLRFLYFSRNKNQEYLFSFIMTNVTIFFMCHLLSNVKINMGFALGLFAIFGIIRYRTNPIPIKEMTYLFTLITIAVINALANKKVSFGELIFTNIAIIGFIYIVEHIQFFKQVQKKGIYYDKIELITQDKREELIEDLKKRTGIDVLYLEIKRIDFLKDTCEIDIFYH